ncbi:MAG: hypothetical protein ACXAE3_10850 [Candidatus Kariarchaeaceae archaeon]|jgi:hypothetical protein
MDYLKLLGVAILILSVLSPPGPSISDSDALGLDQGTLVTSYNTTEVTLYRNETETLRAEVRRDGSLVTGAFFLIPELNYDLGETVYDLSNGTYLIQFIPAANEVIETGNYSVDLVTVHQDINVSSVLQFNLLSYDDVPPNLVVYEPLSGMTYTTFMFLNLTGWDNVGWSELVVEFRGVEVFTLLQEEEDYGRGEWNATHVQFADYIFFENILGSNEIRISLVDTSYNRKSEVRNSVGDALPPSIEWIKPLDGSILTERTVEFSWTISDNTAVDSISLSVNSFPIADLSGDTTGTTQTLAIPDDLVQILTFTLTATDTNGNSNSASITVTFNANFVEEQQDSETQQFLDILLYIILGVSGILSLILIRVIVLSLRTRGDQKKVMQALFPKSDVVDMLHLGQVNEDKVTLTTQLLASFESRLKANTWDQIVHELQSLKISIGHLLGEGELLDLISLRLDNWYHQTNDRIRASA